MKSRLTLAPQRDVRRQRGAVAVIFGLTVVVLVGFIGLAIDLGRFFVIKSELQNAMDACALSAATQLRPGASDPNAVTRAVAYGNVFSSESSSDQSIVRNRVNFQGETIKPSVIKITFSDTNGGVYEAPPPAGPELTALSNRAKFVKCEYPLSGLPIYFMRVLNMLPTASIPATQTVSAMAVATRDAPAAACLPIAVCRLPTAAGTDEWGRRKGEWMLAYGGGEYGTGHFGWVDFTPAGAGPSGSNGADELREILAGSRQCNVSETGSPVNSNGAMTALDEAWNSRFGWYRQGGGYSPTEARPDFTGYAYSNEAGANWLSGFNAYEGAGGYKLNARPNNLPYQADIPVGIKTNQYQTPLTTAQLIEYGRTDRRIATAPIVDCTTWNPPNPQPNLSTSILGWACVFMLHPTTNNGSAASQVAKIEYLGPLSEAGNPCAGGSALAAAPVLTQ